MSLITDFLSIDGQLHILSLLVTVCVLTIFELIFFYVVIVPQVNDLLDDKYTLIRNEISSLSEEKKAELLDILNISNPTILSYLNINNEVDTIASGIGDVDVSVQNILNVLVDRENDLINNNNLNTILTGITIILFLICFILFTISNIKNNLEGQSHKLIGSLLMGGIVVTFLIAFQILFYNFGQNYSYTTNNEFVKLIINSLDLE